MLVTLLSKAVPSSPLVDNKIDEQMDTQMDAWMDKQMDKQMDEQMNTRKDKWAPVIAKKGQTLY